jgi:hypothetical protein
MGMLLTLHPVLFVQSRFADSVSSFECNQVRDSSRQQVRPQI